VGVPGAPSLRSTHCTLILGGVLANRDSRLASIRALVTLPRKHSALIWLRVAWPRSQRKASTRFDSSAGHEAGGDGDCIGFRAFAAGMGHVADQAMQARRIGHGRVAMRDHRRPSAVIGIVRR